MRPPKFTAGLTWLLFSDRPAPAADRPSAWIRQFGSSLHNRGWYSAISKALFSKPYPDATQPDPDSVAFASGAAGFPSKGKPQALTKEVNGAGR